MMRQNSDLPFLVGNLSQEIRLEHHAGHKSRASRKVGCDPKATFANMDSPGLTADRGLTASAYLLTLDDLANCNKPVIAVETEADVRELVPHAKL